MNRKTFYYRQKVTDAELNGAFTDVEDAIWALIVDTLMVGVFSGQAVTAAAVPDLTVNVSAGVGYSGQGRRLLLQSPQNVDLSADFSGASTAVTTGGNERIVSLFIRPVRINSDARTDGNGNPVLFENDEGVGFYVVAGNEATAGNAVPPALQADKILLADITRSAGVSTISAGNISTTRRQNSTLPTTVLARYNAHVAGSADRHPATQVDYAGSPSLADGTTISASTMEAALDALVTALGGTTGSNKVGGETFNPGNGIFSLVAGTVRSQLRAIATRLDGPTMDPATQVASSISITAGDGRRVLIVNTASGPVSIGLPAAASSNGRRILVIDKNGTFGTNNCQINRAGTEKIVGIAANFVCSANWGAYSFVCDGTDWYLAGS